MTAKAMDIGLRASPNDLSIEQVIQRFPARVNAKDVLAALEADGAAIVEGVFSDDEVAYKRAVVESLFDTTPMGRNQFEGYRTQRVYALLAKTRAFDDLATHPLIARLLTASLGEHHLSAATAIQVGAGEQRQMAHHDDQVYPLPWPHPQLVLSALVALCDFSQANGATYTTLGSHHVAPDANAAPDATVVAEMPAGSLLVTLGGLWHGAGANDTDQPRPGVKMTYAASWLRPQETQLLAVPADIARDLPAELQELLGYNIYPPFLGYVDGRHPRHLLEE